jgi:hypothetical protein
MLHCLVKSHPPLGLSAALKTSLIRKKVFRENGPNPSGGSKVALALVINKLEGYSKRAAPIECPWRL